jgi:excinuclease ABC subunit A
LFVLTGQIKYDMLDDDIFIKKVMSKLVKLSASPVIKISGARVNNLKNVSLEIPKNKLVVITGLSGSGKSSLAFDTIYAEGQRRYAESLSSYAKQFLDLMDKPDVDLIEGLSPTIAIDQKQSSINPRSTVGTITEIYDYLRLLYAKIGTVHCHKCGEALSRQTAEQIIAQIAELPEGERVKILSPIVFNKKGAHTKIIENLLKANYEIFKIDGSFYEAYEISQNKLVLDKDENHTIEVQIDDLPINKEIKLLNEKDVSFERLKKAVLLALDLSNGFINAVYGDHQEKKFNLYYVCLKCGISISEIEPRTFSFNSPFGACPACRGLGVKLNPDRDLIIPNKKLTLAEGAIKPWSRNFASQNSNMKLLEAVARKYKFSLNVPVKELPESIVDLIFSGDGEEYSVDDKTLVFDGVLKFLDDKYNDTKSEYLQKTLEDYMRVSTCHSCKGTRLKPESLAVKIEGLNISQLTALPIDSLDQLLLDWSKKWHQKKEGKIAAQLLREIAKKISFLLNVGLGYLTLSRAANTLAGGESQRIRLATQIGSGLESVTYILDEPSIGLHPKNTEKLINTLRTLKDKGNSVIVVEHDEQIMEASDWLIDVGPGAGVFGGEIIAEGTVAQVKKNKNSITGRYLSGIKRIEARSLLRDGNGKSIEIIGAKEFNLKNINVSIPLGKLVVITGVSGSGKSTLMNEILAKALSNRFYRTKDLPGAHKEIKGLENLDKVINIDQSAIGRTPRSNPATYTGVFTYIRDLYSGLPEAKIRGFKQGHFSFNVKGGGRCESCAGDGMVKIEMQFLPDVYIECEECHGRRYNREALEIYYKNKNISDVLNMSVSEAKMFFEGQSQIVDKLEILEQVGLGYLRLGQSATTLSGGEAQRVKLATELSRRPTGKTLYILDEPTTGLHFDDIKRLLQVLNRLADKDNSVLIIEHNLEVIKSADWVIDLGPEGGDKGGYLVAEGTPYEVAKVKESYTGRYLKQVLDK